MTRGRSSLGNATCNVTICKVITRDQGSNMSEGIDKLYFQVAHLQWQMVGGVRVMAMSLVFGQLIGISTRLDSSELPGAGTQIEQRWRCHPRN